MFGVTKPQSGPDPRKIDEDKQNECLCFKVEWKDTVIGITRPFLLKYWPFDNSVSMLEVNHTGKVKIFLKRMMVESVNAKDIVLGRMISILGRQLKIVGFGDDATKKKVTSNEECVSLIFHGQRSFTNVSLFFDSAFEANPSFNIEYLRSVLITSDDTSPVMDSPSLSQPSSGAEVSIIATLKGLKSRYFAERWYETCVEGVRETVTVLPQGSVISTTQGSTFSSSESSVSSSSMLSEVSETTSTAVGSRNKQQIIADHQGSTAKELASKKQKELTEKFERIPSSAVCLNETESSDPVVLAVIKPHTISQGTIGSVLKSLCVDSGFVVSAIQRRQLTEDEALELMTVYKGVVPEHRNLVNALLMGPSLGLQITGKKGQSDLSLAKQVRDYLGPRDSTVARHCAEHTLRAKYGQDFVNNAVQSTDLPMDGILECKFWFGSQQ